MSVEKTKQIHMENNTEKICLMKTNKKRIHERIQGQHIVEHFSSNSVFKIDVMTNFIQDDVEGFSDAEVYTDDDGSEDGLLDLDKNALAAGSNPAHGVPEIRDGKDL